MGKKESVLQALKSRTASQTLWQTGKRVRLGICLPPSACLWHLF